MMLSAGNGFIMQSDKYSRENAGQSLKKYILLKKGELAYNHGASKAKQFGCCYELKLPEARIPYVYHCFSVNDQYTPYIALLLNNPKIDKQLKRLVSSSVRMDGLLNISYEEYMSILLYLPTVAEQTKVADFLHLVDAKIEKQRLLVEALKKYKRGLIKELFSRFTVIEYKTIGELASMFSGGTPRSGVSQYYGGEIPFIRSGEIHGCATELFLTDDGLRSSSAKMVNKGDLLYALYGATSGEVDISKIHGAINQAILCIRPFGVSTAYLAIWLEHKKTDILSTMLQGGQGNLSAELVKSIKVPIMQPTHELFITEIVDKINKKISHQDDILSQMLNLKCSLLQTLFI